MNNIQHNIVRIAETMNRYGVEYMFIGKGAAMMQGYPDTTQDADIYPEKSKENCVKILAAMDELGFELTENQKSEILSGKDFVQFLEPFEFDIVFSPDGFESYSEAKKYKTVIDEIPLMTLRGIIRSKKAANRPKDKESLPRLVSFEEWKRNNTVNEEIKLFEFYASLSLDERIERGFIRTYRPVIDDVSYRSFDSMAEYRSWCDKHVPKFLGFGNNL